MAFEPLMTKVSVGEIRANRPVPNITLEGAKFYGRPNFSGEVDQFKDASKKFTVLIPNEAADALRDLGYNVKTSTMRPDEPNPSEWEPTSYLKVKVDSVETGSTSAHLIMESAEGMIPEKLSDSTIGILDRSRVKNLDLEIRAWNYNKDEADKGLEERMWSARMVTLVAVIEPNILQQKYGALI